MKMNTPVGKCPNCKQNNSLENQHCDFCGLKLPWAKTITQPNPVEPTSSVPSRIWKSFAAASLLFIFVLGGILAFRSSSHDQEGITANTISSVNTKTPTPKIAATATPSSDTAVEPDTQVTAPSLPQHTVTYRVTGQVRYSHGRAQIYGDSPDRYSASKGGAIGPPRIASITTFGSDTGLTNGLVQTLPWSATFSTSNDHLQLSASTDASWVSDYGSKNGLSWYGTVVSEIIVDGVVVDKQESEGDMGTAKCEWVIGPP